MVVRTLERDDLISDVAFGEAFELFFVVLFVYAGAKIELQGLGDVAWVALLLVVMRVLAKVCSVFGLAYGQGQPPHAAAATGLLLVPMAGLAIGLAQTADSLFALEAAQLNVLVLAAVAILETIGPPIAAAAFRLAGEAGQAGGMATEEAHEVASAASEKTLESAPDTPRKIHPDKPATD
jgi:Kef-type K+ transport system membrane component KefB